ncbi:hypothetical protein [Haloimpatiens lingqiaonensis]|uniref:hypothetical protein n=1 Tax=Haloimpatiens lingqiaonensis TaxID=1380675 RepID=UPI0014856168|nr:hypothetical protein [Haloimpatiens lingqiaonensis]
MFNNKKSIYLDDREKIGGKIYYAIFNKLFTKKGKVRQEKGNELLLNNVCNNRFTNWSE